ncbi:D-aminoacylase [Calidithermus terrae]|uniref:D-aminoacylase n=1 Tax=Calidithermus terrae TaxID=1408545 RepID=A0A399DV46_9DEIN|nr:D-aminoacylase [Calidithermus terrae]RIH76054.1 D-aminoacylase [Calidithermus terrae]
MRYDQIIRKARVVDGCGNPWFYGDVAVAGETIAAVAPAGQLSAREARAVLEADGRVLAPGFIDILSHSIQPLMRDGRCLSKVTQGVTTEIMGEAWTPAPQGGQIAPRKLAPYVPEAWNERVRSWRRFGDWLEAMARRGVSPNVGSFLGGGTLREYACGMRMGKASREELEVMRRVVREAMEDGAFGVSYALIYPPDDYADTDEIVEVCKAVAEHGGIYVTHLRSESDRLLEALDEALEIGRRANLPVQVYHLKASREDNWPKMARAIARIDQARKAGQDVTADVYPYTASGTGLTAMLPNWVAEGGGLYEKLRDPAVRARVRAELEGPSPDVDTRSRAEHVMPVGFQKPENQVYVGRRLSQIAAMRGQDPLEAVFDLLVSEGQRIGTIYFSMSEDNLRLELSQPWVMVSTDAGGFDPEWARAHGPVHPRGYGSYPRVLGRYVREEGLLSLEEAVRKMTSLPANRLSLFDRGRIAPGCKADLVLFDPDAITDRATFEDPHRLSVGVDAVWVNGVRVLEEGQHTGATPGQVVRGPGWRSAAS